MRVWEAFWELNTARQGSGFGALPITFQEIRAYCDLTRTSLEAWELSALRKMERALLNAYQNQQGD